MRRLLLLAAMCGMVLLAASPVMAQDEFNCDDFASQPDAQGVFDSDPSDPNGLDADGDGIACESLGDGTTEDGTPEVGLSDGICVGPGEGDPDCAAALLEGLEAEQPLSCDQFISAAGNFSQFQAQQFFDFVATPEERAILDPDGNGFACDGGTIEFGVDPAEAPVSEAVETPAPAATPETSETMTPLPDTGGSSLLLPVGALILGAGLVGLAAVSRR